MTGYRINCFSACQQNQNYRKHAFLEETNFCSNYSNILDLLKTIKYLVINKVCLKLYGENYKTLLQIIKEH